MVMAQPHKQGPRIRQDLYAKIQALAEAQGISIKQALEQHLENTLD